MFSTPNSVNDVDYEYFSVNVVNDGTIDSILTCSYSENRTAPLVNQMENYVLQVINFTIPSSSIPLFNYIGNNKAVFTLSYTNTANTTTGLPVTLNPQIVVLTNGTVGIGGTPQTIQNNTSSIIGDKFNVGQYAVYSVQQFLTAINYALNAAMLLLLSDVRIIVPPVVPSPYFIFNETTQLFSLVADKSFDINNATYNYIQFTSNEYMHRLFTGIPSFFDRSEGILHRKWRYLVFNTQNNSSGTNYIMTTQGSPINYWISCKKLIMTSNRLRINPESVSSNINAIRGASPLTKNIIADFNLNTINNLTDFYTPITFTQFNDVQNAVNILGSGNLFEVDLEIFYIDNLNNTFPILLGEGESFVVKFKFFKYK